MRSLEFNQLIFFEHSAILVVVVAVVSECMTILIDREKTPAY